VLEPDPAVINTATYRRESEYLTWGPRAKMDIQPCGNVSCDGARVAAIVPGGDRIADGIMEPDAGYGAPSTTDGTWRGSMYHVASTAAGPTVHVFDRWKDRDLLKIAAPEARTAGFSKTGTYVAALGKKALRIWRVADGKHVWTIEADGTIAMAGFAGCDRYWYLLSKNREEIYDEPGRFQAGAITAETPLRSSVAIDGVRRATVCDCGGRAWLQLQPNLALLLDPRTGWRVATLPAAGEAAFSRDCGEVAALSGTELVVWSAVTGRELHRLRTGEKPERWVFTPDGMHMVTAVPPVSSSSSARVWDLETGAEIARISNQQDPGNAGIARVFFGDGEDGRLRLVVGHTAANAAIPVSAWWRTADLVERACRQLSRNLTRAEWTEYLGIERYRKTCPNLP